MENSNAHSPEFLEAAEQLLPLLKSIPRSAMLRHNISFENVINSTIAEAKATEEPLTIVLAQNLSYYINYGMSKMEWGLECINQYTGKPLNEVAKNS